MTKRTGFIHESAYNESKEWYTPRRIFDALGLQFDLDPASPGAEIVPWIPATKHLMVLENGLTADWSGLAFVNPPYGADTPKWMKKLAEHGNGIGLIFSRTDTDWFFHHIARADAILFIKGRVKFVPYKYAESYAKRLYTPAGGCGAGSMLVAFGQTAKRALERSNLGRIFYPESS